jgi:hypothetical protein
LGQNTLSSLGVRVVKDADRNTASDDADGVFPEDGGFDTFGFERGPQAMSLANALGSEDFFHEASRNGSVCAV